MYLHAARTLGIRPAESLVVEDSMKRALSAGAAGVPPVGIVPFVPEADRAERSEALREAGVAAVVGSWAELEELLGVSAGAAG